MAFDNLLVDQMAVDLADTIFRNTEPFLRGY